MSYVALECFHNTAFHFIETLKVRGMARNIRSGDVSLYFANTVQTKRKYISFSAKLSLYNLCFIFFCIALISGVVSGFFGAATGSLSFMIAHNLLT